MTTVSESVVPTNERENPAANLSCGTFTNPVGFSLFESVMDEKRCPKCTKTLALRVPTASPTVAITTGGSGVPTPQPL